MYRDGSPARLTQSPRSKADGQQGMTGNREWLMCSFLSTCGVSHGKPKYGGVGRHMAARFPQTR
jgi:hypothetical protein